MSDIDGILGVWATVLLFVGASGLNYYETNKSKDEFTKNKIGTKVYLSFTLYTILTGMLTMASTFFIH